MPFINGRCLREGLVLKELDAVDFIDVLMDFFVEDAMSELAEDRDKARASVLSRMSTGYDSNKQYGRSNDSFGPPSDAPLPYIPTTEHTEDGYAGLDPPVG